MTTRVALLVSDVAPERDLTESLAASGYYIEFAYSAEAALQRLEARAPTLAVVGPLPKGEDALALLNQLENQRISTLVISDDVELVEAAELYNMQVRPPARTH